MNQGVRAVADPDGNVYFIFLTAENEFPDKQSPSRKHSSGTIPAFYTTDCLIDRIETSDGAEVGSIDGKGLIGNKVRYTKGCRITRQKTFYCRNKNDLLNTHYLTMMNGKLVLMSADLLLDKLFEFLKTPLFK